MWVRHCGCFLRPCSACCLLLASTCPVCNWYELSRVIETTLCALRLGAGKSRLFQATLMESLVLAAVGGAVAGIRHFRAIAPANLPRIHQIEISWSVLVFACRISMLSAILAGTLPALRSLHTDPQRALQSASSRIGYGRNAGLARRWLVSFEIACTIVLLIVTGLVVRSFSRVAEGG